MTGGESLPGWLRPAQRLVLGAYLVSLLTSLSAMEIFSTGIALLALVEISASPLARRSLKEIPFLLPLGAFVGVAVLGILLGETDWARKRYDLGRLRFFLLYAALWVTLRGLLPDTRWMRVIAAIAVPLALYGTLQHFFPIDWLRPEGRKIVLYAVPEEERGPLVLGAFNHHLTFANVAAIHACLLAGTGLAAARRWPWLGLAAWLGLLCVWTGSRTVWIALPIALAVLLVAWGARRQALILALATLVASAALVASSEELRRRATRLFDETNFHSSIGPRQRLWAANWAMFREHPILGVGYNNNERLAPSYLARLYPDDRSMSGHAHSTPLQILATTGLAGAAAFLWLWAAVALRLRDCLRSADRETRGTAAGLAGAFVAFHVLGLTQWNFGDAEVLHSVMFALALAGSLSTTLRFSAARD